MSQFVDCVMVGNKEIGKRALLARFAEAEKMGDEVSLTMQVEGRPVELVVKIADEHVESKVRRLMYLKADVVILGYSAIDIPSFEALKKTWVREVQHQVPNAPIVLMGTKLDRVPAHLHERVKAKGEATSAELGTAGFQLVSANPKFEGNLHLQLVDRAVHAGLAYKQQRLEKQERLKNRAGFWSCFVKRQQKGLDVMSEHANENEDEDLLSIATSRSFSWRGELLCGLVEEFASGHHVEYGVNDSARDMLAPFTLDDIARPMFEVLSKLLLLYHFTPVASRCLELHNMEFCMEVKELKHDPELLLKKKKGLKREALRIFRSYVAENAKREIRLSEEERDQVMGAIKAVSNSALFDDPYNRLLTELAVFFRERFARTLTARRVLSLLREHAELLPAVKEVEADEFPKFTGDGLNRMLKQVMHIMAFMEFLQSAASADKRPAQPEFLKQTDTSRTIRDGVQSLVVFAALKLHIDKERSLENPMFWLDAEDFRSFEFGSPENESHESFERRVLRLQAERAEYIVRRYINDDAEWLINLPAAMTKSIQMQLKSLQAAVAAERGGADLIRGARTIFDAAQRETLLLVRRDSWTRFSSSSAGQQAKLLVQKLFSPEEFVDLEFNRHEAKIQARFDLHLDDKLVQSFHCALEGKMVLHGELSLFKRYLCFFSSVFGFKTKLRYALVDIVSVDEHVEAVGHAGKRGKSSEGGVVITTKDSQRHVFRNILPNSKQLVYMLQKARQRVDTEKQPEDAGRTRPLPDPYALENDDDDVVKGMSEKDWELFKEGADVVEYQEGELVFEEGAPAGNVYQIARGSCRIEKTMANGEKAVLRTCAAGEIIGEVSFIEGGTTSASVVANENVVVYVMSRDFIEDALVNHPGLSGRFYKVIAALLADRVKTKKILKKPAVGCDAQPGKDAAFHCKFRMSDAHDTVLTEWGASMREHNMTLFGSLYLTRMAVCFFSRVLASTKRYFIPFHDIDRVETNPKSLVVVCRDQDKRFEFFHLDNIQETRRTLQEAIAKGKGKSPGPMRRARTDAREDVDWSMFLAGAELRRFKKDQPILRLGEQSHCVFQIGRGSALAHRDTGNGNVQVYRQVGPGEIFGEISFLLGGQASSGVVADDDDTFVYCIEKTFVDSLLHQNAELPGRFYRFLATSLAARLRE